MRARRKPPTRTVKVPLDRVQRSGVRTGEVVSRRLVQPVRALGTVKIDERRLHTVTLRADAYIEELYERELSVSERGHVSLLPMTSAPLRSSASRSSEAAGPGRRRSLVEGDLVIDLRASTMTGL